MIIVDYSGIALASIIINKTFDEGLIRHMILNSLRMYRTKYTVYYVLSIVSYIMPTYFILCVL